MKIRFINCKDPFDPYNNRDDEILNCSEDFTILDYLEQKYPGFTEFEEPTVCVLNGNPILREGWGKPLNNGDVVLFHKLAPGAAAVIVAVVVAVIAIGAAIYYANQIPDATVGSIPEQQPSHTLTGQYNKFKLQQPIEAPYGKCRIWPSYASKPYNNFLNDDQYYYGLFTIGQGEYTIHDVYVDDTEVSTFEDFNYEVIPPGGSPTLVHSDVITSVEVGNLELYGPNEPDYPGGPTGPFATNPSGGTINRIEVDITLPKGLYEANKKGNLDSFQVTSLFEYREIDDSGIPVGSWITLVDFDVSLKTVDAKRYTYHVDVPVGRYEVRAVRTNDASDSHKVGDTVVWSKLRGFAPDTNDYGNVTLLAIKARATNNLNDQSQNKFNVSATRKLPTWNPSTGWSILTTTRSLIWAFCDVFRSSYGAKLADEYLDLETLYLKDQEFTSLGVYFDWVFENKTTVWEAAKIIARVGRSTPVLNGPLVSMVRDEQQTLPSAVFNQENMTPDSVKWDVKFFAEGDYDSVLIGYTDPTTWNVEEILCTLPEFPTSGSNPKKVTLSGCTDRNIAYREGLYMVATMFYANENLTFTTGLEGYIPTYGSLVSVNWDVPQWGQSGYIRSSVGDQELTLSEPVEFEAGSTHYIALRDKDGSGLGPFECTETAEPNVVNLVNPIPGQIYTDLNAEPQLFQFGVADKWSKLGVVVDIRPSGKEEIEISCINYANELHQYGSVIAPQKGEDPALFIPPLPVVDELLVFPVPNTRDYVRLNWDAALGARSYILEQSVDNVNWTKVEEVVTPGYTLAVQPGTLWLRVAGINEGQGPWALWDGDVGEPSGPADTPENMELNGSPTNTIITGTQAVISWDPLLAADFYEVKILTPESTTPGVAGPMVERRTYNTTEASTVIDPDVGVFMTKAANQVRVEIRAWNNLGVSGTLGKTFTIDAQSSVDVSSIEMVNVVSPRTPAGYYQNITFQWESLDNERIIDYAVFIQRDDSGTDTPIFDWDSFGGTGYLGRTKGTSRTIEVLNNIPTLETATYYVWVIPIYLWARWNPIEQVPTTEPYATILPAPNPS